MTMPAKGSTSEVEMARQMDSRGSEFLGEVARKLEQVRLPEVERLPKTTALASFSNDEVLRLPVVLGQSSPVWVSRWMQERGELPPERLVRVEEFINAVSLRTSKEWKGLSYGVEVMPCPWSEDSLLLAVQLTAGDADLNGLELRSLGTVTRRVMGSFSRRSDAELPDLLPAGRSTLVMLEIESTEPEIGRLEVSLGDLKTEVVPASSETEPSPEMARSVAMAGYALWLRGELNDEAFAATIEAVNEVDPGAIHRELRLGIEQAKKLAEAGR